jgi:hypothetical protein
LVSKFWRSVALELAPELLYESVTFKRPLSTISDTPFSRSKRPSPISSFLNALLCDQSAAELHNAAYNDPQQRVRPVTNLVRRLEIRPASDEYWYHSAISDHNALHLSVLFPNLSVLIMTNTVDSPVGIISQIVLKSGCPLRHFETDCRKYWSAEIIRNAASTLEFVSFNCKDQSYSHSDSDMVLPFTLPRAHTVEIRNIESGEIIVWFTKCHFPSLQRLVFQPHPSMTSFGVPGMTAIHGFFTVVGRTVTSLDVRSIDEFPTFGGFAIILRSFPLLQELGINCAAISTRDLDDTGLFRPHSSLVLLNLTIGQPRVPRDGIGNFGPIMERLKPHLDLLLERFIKPMLVQGKLSLRHVRLLNVKSLGFSMYALHPEEENIWRCWIDQFGAAQVRLEFSGGDLISTRDETEPVSSDGDWL